ncbi:MAG: hypothetical protein L0154_21475 [Chloroflexi bacterium]|nr:hypothetical protein [Chloroflexota bacterium]
MKRFLFFITLIILILPRLPSAAQDDINLLPFQPVSGTLNDDEPSQLWRFEGQAGQVISLLAQTTGGDLNPIIALRKVQGEIIIANDDSRFGDLDARLEGVALPEDGVYQVRVYREGENQGTTSGDYRLTLLEGYGSTPFIYRTTSERIWLRQTMPQQEVVLAELPEDDFYLRADVQVTHNEDNLPLEIGWRFREDWVFTWTLAGDWQYSTSLESDSGVYDALTEQAIQVEFLIHADTLTLFVNGEEVTAQPLTSEPGDSNAVSVTYAMPEDAQIAPSLIIENLLISGVYYEEDSLAVPPIDPQDRIYSYDGIHTQVMAELYAKDIVPEGGRGLQATVNGGFVFTDRVGFSAYPLFADRVFENFVMSFVSVVRRGNDNTACGLLFHESDENESFATALATPNRDLYFLNYEDGELSGENIVTRSPALRGGLQTGNYILVIAMDHTGLIYVNGLLQGQIELASERGELFVQVVVDEEIDANCLMTNAWVWELP